ncbi:alkaline phosphatase D family protein [Streptomyces sp. NPDC006879]|uniref:alkaline phosphatase D family protein n=1 Tax=Streptomyces sp. NPDC006879 TaxID=3364767 RepID=UPI003678FAAC
MAGLRLGPMLRYVDWEGAGTATVWVEADRPCTARVHCADGAGGAARTFQVAGHHYALIQVNGLTAGTTTSYEVLLDGQRVWPLTESQSPFPPSTITSPRGRTDGAGNAEAVRIAFGSCRWAAPPADSHDRVGPDVLDTLAARLACDPTGERPDVLLLLGDQVYADQTSEATRRWLGNRRDLTEPPGPQVADYEEYTRLYYESWLDPGVRWLLSTVPSCMIFDDHDVIDDWNTSASWLAEMRTRPWWRERVLSGLMSYWVHQHLGNLSPADLETDPLYKAVQETPDGTEALRRFAATSDMDVASVRWSYRRDFGRARLLMVDTRAARALEEGRRAMLVVEEEGWLREQALAGQVRAEYDHLLIGSSLPWLLPPLVHEAEAWNAALCRSERGDRWARLSEALRRRSDLEHWAAFPASFARLAELIRSVGSGQGAPATVCVLSGDVHHAYVAEPDFGATVSARIFQLTCSPVHNSIPASIRLGFWFGWNRAARRLGRILRRHGRVAPPPVKWRRTGGPWFGNQLMTLTLHGRSARLRLDQARKSRRGGAKASGARLVTVEERELSGP